MKRYWSLYLSIFLALGLCSCDPEATVCLSKKCDSSGGGFGQSCFMVSGEEVCKTPCHGDKAGENAPVCWQNASLGPDAPWYSLVDTCAASDKLYELYSVDTKLTKCSGGCENGICLSEPAQSSCKDTCNIVGGRNYSCFSVTGVEECLPSCLGDKAGQNRVCYKNASLGPIAAEQAAVDTCVGDDKGNLYSIKTDYTVCEKGCENGQCKGEPGPQPQPQCEMDCSSIVGGRVHDCFVISGKASCEPTCFGDKEGANAPYCYINSSLGPSATWQSTIDTCAKDDNGKIYSVNTQYNECKGSCEDGACKDEPVPQPQPECEMDCGAYAGGRTHDCYVVNGEASCRPKCFGDKKGENAPTCWINSSLGPNASWKQVVDTCEADDNGKVYSVDTVYNDCGGGTCENGECKDAPGPQPACEMDCSSIVGGRVHECFVISGKASCEPICFGDKAGENAPYCYINNSLGPSATWQSTVDSCAKDDNGKIYSVNTEYTECKNNKCSNGKCE